jgi:hypothetical protein
MRGRVKDARCVETLLRTALARGAASMLLFAALAAPLAAQTSRTDPTDLHSWYGATLELDLPNAWLASLQYRARMQNNASSYLGSYVTAEIAKGVIDDVDLLGSYRLALVDSATYHRFAFGAEGTRDFGDLRVTFRPIVQYQKRTFEGDDEQSGDARTLLRTRLRARYPLADALDAYASVEPYFQFGEGYPIDNWRNTIGLKYEIVDGLKVDGFYIFRPDYGKSYNRTFHIIGIDLEWTWQVP